MAEMGKYCKAYLVKDFRNHDAWRENLDNLSPKTEEGGGNKSRTPLDDEGILYLQENYVVTDGIFKDENIIFDNVTPEWKAFCKETLNFEIPSDVIDAGEAAAAD